jgi:hypothetical protein
MPIALSIVEGCAQSPRSNVLAKYAAARRFFARLASEIFLSSLQQSFFSNPLARGKGVPLLNRTFVSRNDRDLVSGQKPG